MLFDFPLGFPRGNAGVALGPADGAVDEMGNTGFLSDIRQVLTLLDFAPEAGNPVILNAEDAINTARGSFQGGRILQISLYNFNALARQFLGSVALCVAG